MKKLLLISLLLVPIIVHSQTEVPPGPVSGNWTIDGSPYMVNGDIYIEFISSLTIEPGVEVRFTGRYKFIVDGILSAIGTETDSILFTADDTLTRWFGIRIIENLMTVSMDYCIVEYGRTDTTEFTFPENAGGGICIYNCQYSTISIFNSSIRRNEAYYGGGIQCDNANAIIDRCSITHNYAHGRGGGLQYFRECDPILTNSTIASNHTDEHGGGLTCDANCHLLMEGNRIIHNTALKDGGGIDIWAAGGLVAERNLFAHNTAQHGGGLSVYTSDYTKFSDNTIVYNEANSDEFGGGVICYSGNTPTFTSDIIYFNTADGSANQVYLQAEAVPSFEYCDVEDSYHGFTGPGGENFNGEYKFCIDDDPLFADELNDDFSLRWDNYPYPDYTRSPCIDTGCPDSLPDPDSTRNDIGAYYFFQQLDVPNALDAIVIPPTSFLAQWNSAYGALGYRLDVALDPEFENLILENIEIEGDTSYLVEDATQTMYYYRVRSYNTALISDNSNIVAVAMVGVKEENIQTIDIYSAYDRVYIYSDRKNPSSEVAFIFDASGRLLHQARIAPGSNMIKLESSCQLIFVKVVSDGKVYQKKLLIH